MNNTTSNDTSVKVLSDARNEELLSIFRTLHGKVMTALQEVGVKPTFNDKFDACTNEDYKGLHEQARILLRAKGKAVFEARIGGIRAGIQGTSETYLNKARAAKAHMDSLPAEVKSFLPAFATTVNVPVSELVGFWPQGTSMEAIVRDLTALKYSLVKGEDKSFSIKIAYSDAKVEDKAPVSGEVESKAA